MCSEARGEEKRRLPTTQGGKRPAPSSSRLKPSDACTHVGAALGLAILFAWTYVEDHYLKPFDKRIDPNSNNGTGSGDGNDLIAEEAAGYSVGEEAHHIVSY